MSTTQSTDDAVESFIDDLQETFEPWMKSRQALDAQGIPKSERKPQEAGSRHNDGEAIFREFGLEPFWKYLEKAARNDHAVANHPQALPHLVTHLEKWERWELTSENPDFGDIPRSRQRVLDWFRGLDKDDPREQQKAHKHRIKRWRPGGTGVMAHGEQGTTKTTCIYWLTANIHQVNPREDIIWQSTLDDVEWMTFAPFATLCLPKGVDVRVEADPLTRELRNRSGNIELEPDDISRDVIRYSDPRDLLQQIDGRTRGQIYVVYPDPYFRGCEAITGWSYENVWEVDEAVAATDLYHFRFAIMEQIAHGSELNSWVTLVEDEAQKFLKKGKGNDEHDWWNKIDDWVTTWGDARKKRLSALLSVHDWKMIPDAVRSKIRWGATMNGEEYPPGAPVKGSNDGQDLGETCIWSKQKWNHVGYPDIKRNFAVPAEINVTYPRWEEVTNDKS